MVARETLGYPTQTLAILGLHGQGCTVSEIVAATAVPRNVIHRAIRGADLKPNVKAGEVRNYGARSKNPWFELEERALRDFIKEQDAKFQLRMRVLMQMAARQTAPVPNVLAKPTWKVILDAVSDKHHIGVKDILGTSRSKNIVAARHEVFWRLHTETNMSLAQIAERIGGRDHTTVRSAVLRYSRRMTGSHVQ